MYAEKTDPAPLYAIPLETVQGILEDPKNPDKHIVTISPTSNSNQAKANLATVLLKERDTGKQLYQFTFDTTSDKSIPKRFLDIVNSKSKSSGGQVVTASIVTAKAVGEKAAKLQPKHIESH